MSSSTLSQRWPWILAAAAVIVVYLGSSIKFNTDQREDASTLTAGPEDIRRFAERDDTNILFIVIDTLRADRLGMYGYERDTSPFLDQLADRGVRFDRHLAQSSWTKCSMASLWTGLNPPRTGVTRFNHALPEEAKMPAEILRDHGFQTIGLYRNGWVSGYFGFAQGFDVYLKPTARKVPAAIRRENPTLSHQGTDLDVVETAAEFLRVNGDKRWFLYLHLMDVHEFVYDIESALFGTTNSDIYDAAIRHEDYVIESLVMELRTQGLRENTLIVIASDHGEAFGERGFEGHAREIHRETTEVPLIFSFPFDLAEGVVVNTRTANVDIWPTLFDLIGLPTLDDIDGVSRLDDILSGGPRPPVPDHRPNRAFSLLDQTWGTNGAASLTSIAITEGPLRYVIGHERGRWIDYLFDSEADPKELKNLAKQSPEIVEKFRALAKEFANQNVKWADGAPELEIDEMQLNQLRALGYQLP